jgi:hypothetical protein
VRMGADRRLVCVVCMKKVVNRNARSGCVTSVSVSFFIPVGK